MIGKKSCYGFIENEDASKELFFSFCNCKVSPDSLQIGSRVTYVSVCKGIGGYESAVVLDLSHAQDSDDTRPSPVLESHIGVVTSCIGKKQNGSYRGEICLNNSLFYSFGVSSLLNRRESLAAGDEVSFQSSYGTNKALNVSKLTSRFRCKVETVQGEIL